MHTSTAAAPIDAACRPDLVLAPQDHGGLVVKDPRTGAYYQLGPQEAFLLRSLDGRRTLGELCAGFRQQFDEPLTEDEARESVELATAQGLTVTPGAAPPVAPPAAPPSPPAGTPAVRQSVLYWRKSFFDPDRLFTRLEPYLRPVWTRAFVTAALVGIVAAAVVAWVGRAELAGAAVGALRWETAVLVWLALAAVTTAHEFAHGLTCKHHGGEVHEVGFLLMFFMPCFYCNVSDSWLLPGRRARMAVTAAGLFCDLCVWAAAVFVWRVTPPGLLANHLALVVLSVCGLRTLLNLNPLIRLDGYYLLSDLVGVPNLQAQAQGHLKAHLRRLLWGAERPPPLPHGRFLVAYGLASWLFPIVLLSLLFLSLGESLAAALGPVGAGLALGAAVFVLSGPFGGLVGGEAREMVRTRRGRVAGWAVVLAAGAAALAFWEIEDRSGGPFQVRPAVRAEVAGFLRDVAADEGDAVAAGQPVARVEVPYLDSKRAQKRAERKEGEARLRLLEVGTRPEQVAAQREKAARARDWRDLAKSDLAQARLVFKADLDRLDEQVAEAKAERKFATDAHARGEQLRASGVASATELDNLARKKAVCDAQLEQAEARRRARVETGTLAAEAELARREKELADTRATLELLEAGSRPEELDAERARLERLREEIAHLERQERKQAVRAPAAGVVTTRRLRECAGRYYREGELICTVEETGGLEAEIALDERQVARVRAGQPVELKVQVLPLETFAGKVDRIGARAAAEKDPVKAQTSVIAYCRLDRAAPELRPGMTGYARVSCGRRPVGAILADRALRSVRPEYWWW